MDPMGYFKIQKLFVQLTVFVSFICLSMGGNSESLLIAWTWEAHLQNPRHVKKFRCVLPMLNIKQKIGKFTETSNLLFLSSSLLFVPQVYIFFRWTKNQPNGNRHTLRKRLRIFKGPVVPLKDRPQATRDPGKMNGWNLPGNYGIQPF